jgi:hypothetical protein
VVLLQEVAREWDVEHVESTLKRGPRVLVLVEEGQLAWSQAEENQVRIVSLN